MRSSGRGTARDRSIATSLIDDASSQLAARVPHPSRLAAIHLLPGRRYWIDAALYTLSRGKGAAMQIGEGKQNKCLNIRFFEGKTGKTLKNSMEK